VRPEVSPSRPAGREVVGEILLFSAGWAREVIDLWNAALGDAFPMGDRLFLQNTVRDPHFEADGCWVVRAPRGGQVVGFCLAKTAREPLGADGLMADRGWVSTLVVHPAVRRRGLGGRLLARAETYLRGRGRKRAIFGGDPAHFFPGIPVSDAALAFFAANGYRLRGDAYDLRRSLEGYLTPPEVEAALAAHPEVEIRPLRSGEERGALDFLDEAFPGRWRYTLGRFLSGGGAIGDVIGVLQGGAVRGFAQIFHRGSQWIGPSIAWTAESSTSTGGLGPMGMAPALRGRGLGLALVDRSIQHLRTLGVTEMVIDWTILIGFYGRLGFVPWRHYRHGEKVL